MGYCLGVAPPGRCSPPYLAGPCEAGDSSTEPYIATHNMLLAHATAVSLYKEKFQKIQGGEIGLTLVGKYFEPYSESKDDKAAAERLLDFELGWFMEPLVYGDYPESMKSLVKERLPTFTDEEKELVKGSFDFIGINYYTSRYAKSGVPVQPPRYTTDSLATQEHEKDGVFIGPKAEGSSFIFVYPEGLKKLLCFMKEKYESPKIYITENGITEANVPKCGLDVALKDPHRIINTLRHLYMIHQAMKTGVNVKGYFYWSLFDDFEWVEGYVPRFGLYYIDYEDDLKRIPKESAKWLPSFLKQK
ncbi:Glycoside hydrolase [Trema orientale]|uniref:Glycoside hydrolase n=1 Tax=Trema orientale TaxID=63057 RepID=A0A2P5CRP4_TREOI|nr:Glycoside hydrolase [Trema orientale]